MTEAEVRALITKAITQAVQDHPDVDPVQLKRRIEEAIILVNLEIKGRARSALEHHNEIMANRNLL